MDWLNPALGYLNTASARQKVRQWFRRQERSAHLEQGREVLGKALRRLGLHMTESEVVKALKLDSVEELLVALGSGNLSLAQLDARLASPEEPPPQGAPWGALPERPAAGIQVLGVGNLLTHTAHCCNPVPGDAIVGYITRNRGVTVHRATCSNVLNEDEPERLVSVSWGPLQQLHPVRVEVTSWDRVGLLRDITTMVSAEKVNIASVVMTEPSDGTATITLTLETAGVSQLSRLFAKLESVKGVMSVKRVGPVPPSRGAGD
jgi:GTP pyrophosphokinase